MGYANRTQASSLIGLIVIGLVVSLIVRVVWAGGFENFFVPGKALENEIVAEMEKYPGNEIIFERLEADFPRAYDDFTETLARAARSEGPEDRVLEAGYAWLNAFFANHDDDFANAPIDRLDRVMELELQFLNSLRAHDEYACAAYAKGEPQSEELPPEIEEAGSDVIAARFAAIKGGRTDQQLRLGLPPSAYEAVEATMREKGLGDEQIAVVFGEADPQSIGAPLACEMAIELVEAIRAQPEDARALLIGKYVSGAG